MDWNEFTESVRGHHLFETIGKNLAHTRTDEETKQLLKWLRLVETEAIREWASQEDGWVTVTLACEGNRDADPVLAELLRRYLSDLNTRTDPSRLLSFWQWWITHISGPADLLEVWSPDMLERLRGSALSADAKPIAEQESEFAEILLDVEGRLACADAGEKTRWARDTLHRAAKSRMPPQSRDDAMDRAAVNIVFVWEDQDLLRSGVLRRGFQMSLRLHPRWKAGRRAGLLIDGDVFDQRFREAVQTTAERMGRGRFCPLQFPRDEWPPIGSGRLSGPSGGLAIHTTQILASFTDGDMKSPSLVPPWLTVTATSESQRGGDAGDVGSLEEKIQVLREEGVRVAVITEGQARQLAAPIDQVIIGHRLGAGDLAKRLVQDGYAWPADPALLEPPWNRRRFLVTVSAVSLAVAAGAMVLVPKFQRSQKRTSSMVAMAEKLPGLRRRVAEMESICAEVSEGSRLPLLPLLQRLGLSPNRVGIARNFLLQRARRDRIDPNLIAAAEERIEDEDESWDRPEFPLADFRDKLKAEFAHQLGCDPDQLVLPRKPGATFFHERGLRVLEESKCFNHIDWRPIPGSSKEEADIHRRPVEPAYFCRVLRLEPRHKESDVSLQESIEHDGEGQEICIEYNTSGYGVVPVESDSFDIFVSSMNESVAPDNRTITTIARERIGLNRDLRFCAVYLNAWQDQVVRGRKEDWWGARVQPWTKEADFSIAVPNALGPIFTKDEGRTEGSSWEVRFLGEPEELPEHFVGKEPGSGIEERRDYTWKIWKIPLEWEKWLSLDNEDESSNTQFVFKTSGYWKGNWRAMEEA